MYIARTARREEGFTLVELLLVMAILAILAFLAIPRITDTVKMSRERTCYANCLVVLEGTNRFHADQVGLGIQDESDLWPGLTTVPAAGSHTVDVTDGSGGWSVAMAGETVYQSYFKPVPNCPFGGGHLYQIVYESDGDRITSFNIRCSGVDYSAVPPVH